MADGGGGPWGGRLWEEGLPRGVGLLPPSLSHRGKTEWPRPRAGSSLCTSLCLRSQPSPPAYEAGLFLHFTDGETESGLEPGKDCVIPILLSPYQRQLSLGNEEESEENSGMFCGFWWFPAEVVVGMGQGQGAWMVHR